MYLAVQVVLVITSTLMTLPIPLRRSKNDGPSSLFGGGMQSNLSGPTVVEKNLDRVTIVTVIIWLLYIVLSLLSSTFDWQASHAAHSSAGL